MFKHLYCSKNACDPIEYTFKGADIEAACLTFAQVATAAATRGATWQRLAGHPEA